MCSDGHEQAFCKIILFTIKDSPLFLIRFWKSGWNLGQIQNYIWDWPGSKLWFSKRWYPKEIRWIKLISISQNLTGLTSIRKHCTVLALVLFHYSRAKETALFNSCQSREYSSSLHPTALGEGGGGTILFLCSLFNANCCTAHLSNSSERASLEINQKYTSSILHQWLEHKVCQLFLWVMGVTKQS